MKGKYVVTIYSPNQLISLVLMSFCRKDVSSDNDVVCLCSRKDFLKEISECPPDYIIIDSSPRQDWYMAYLIRHLYPTLPIIFTQDYFLFSDIVVSNYIGNLWLLEYDAAMYIYNDSSNISLSSLFSLEVFSGPFSSGKLRCDFFINSQEYMYIELEKWLRDRLEFVIPSVYACDVFMAWVDDQLSVKNKKKNIRGKKITSYYKRMIINSLGITCSNKNLIPSLTLSRTEVVNE